MSRIVSLLSVLFVSIGVLADTLDLRSDCAVCKVDVEDGARVVSWKVRDEEMLWVPPAPQKDGKWRHGGIPLVWPWLGDEYPDGVTNGPLHGVAWLRPFKVERRARTERREELSLSLEACGLCADYEIAIEGESLELRFTTTNVGSVPRKYAMSIHPYFYLTDRDRATIVGLDGLRYRDAREGFATNGVWRGEMRVDSWLDHEFMTAGRRLSARLIDFASGRRLVIKSNDAAALWVWNPGERWAEIGAALYGELPADAWRHLLSVEPSTDGMKVAKPLAPGEKRTLTAEFSRAGAL